MASSGPIDSSAAAGTTTSPDITNPPTRTSNDPPLSSTPMEMSTLESKSENNPSATADPSSTEPTTSPKKEKDASQADAAPKVPAAHESTTSPTTTPSAPAKLDRTVSTAIGPSSDQPMPVPKDAEVAGPTLMITLLLTNGARHPFRLDSKYLNKRGVNVTDNDPFSLSVYTLKELVLREWRDEWEAKPSSPSSIRLISFGKLLDDKAPLKDSKFSHDSPNVVHMTIKPQEIVDEEDAKGAKGNTSRDREGSERSPGCRCVIL